jgi:hypothetical protein
MMSTLSAYRLLTNLKLFLHKEIIKTVMVDNNKKIIKFHGSQVENIVIRYATRPHNMASDFSIEEFDALKDPQVCETLNVQVVADFVTITFYRDENENSILRRELIPSHAIQHIWVNDV